jgi:hypothetical protein
MTNAPSDVMWSGLSVGATLGAQNYTLRGAWLTNTPLSMMPVALPSELQVTSRRERFNGEDGPDGGKSL